MISWEIKKFLQFPLHFQNGKNMQKILEMMMKKIHLRANNNVNYLININHNKRLNNDHYDDIVFI